MRLQVLQGMSVERFAQTSQDLTFLIPTWYVKYYVDHNAKTPSYTKSM